MNIANNVVNFKDFERNVRDAINQIGCQFIKNQLENWDIILMNERNKERLRHRGRDKTSIKTLMGEVDFLRVRYDIMESGTKTGSVYLLDEAIGLVGSGHFSELMSELIVQASCVGSYRNASREVSEMTGQSISHTAAWNMIQAIGKQVDRQELHSARLATKNKGSGTIETPVLHEEQDGIWLKLQGKDRKKFGKSKEMKLAIAYDGAKKTGKNRYELTNKVACAGIETPEKFFKRKEGMIAATFDVDTIDMRFLGGDGAHWIKRSKTDETVHYQLDTYHRNRAITTYVSDEIARKTIRQLLYTNDVDFLLTVIQAYLDSTEDEDEKANYQQLLTYFTKNKDGLVPIHQRGLNIPELPEGKVYRRLGAMESNVFSIANRMKGKRAAWSIKGANNLARLLCLNITGRLSETLENMGSCIIPERYSEEIPVKISAATIPEDVGSGYNGFRQTLIPSNLKWFKDIASIKPIYS